MCIRDSRRLDAEPASVGQHALRPRERAVRAPPPRRDEVAVTIQLHEPAAATHPAGGAADRVWRLEPGAGWEPREALTVFQSIDYARPDFIPALAEPRRLPAGGAPALLHVAACLIQQPRPA